MGAWRLAMEETQNTLPTWDFKLEAEKHGCWKDSDPRDRSCRGLGVMGVDLEKRDPPGSSVFDVDGEDKPPPPYKDKAGS